MQQRVVNLAPREDMKIVIARLSAFVLLALLLVVSVLEVESTSDEEYDSYVASYAKRYEQNEKKYRQYLKIKKELGNHKHNADPDTEYDRGINEFSDLTEAEFERLYLSLNDIRIQKGITLDELDHEADSKLNISWISHLPPVKDRGRCHADYAFAAVGAVEGLVNIKNNCTENHTSFSEQLIIDCCKNCSGCEGSTATTGNTTKDILESFSYIIDEGLERDIAYPYQNEKE